MDELKPHDYSGRFISKTTFWGAVISLAIGNAVGLWAISNNFGSDITTQINRVGARSCLSSQVTLTKYNSGINGVLPVLVQSRQEYREAGENAKAATYTEAISKLEDARVPVPSDERCLEPLLR